MKSGTKSILIVFGILLLIAPVIYVVAMITALKAHVHEDRVVFGGKAIHYAIGDYCQKHGHPPAKLDELVPEFLETMPVITEVSKVDYQVSPDGTNWTLDLHWTSRSTPLIYRRTSSWLSSEDAKRRIDTINGGYMLKTAGAMTNQSSVTK